MSDIGVKTSTKLFRVYKWSINILWDDDGINVDAYWNKDGIFGCVEYSSNNEEYWWEAYPFFEDNRNRARDYADYVESMVFPSPYDDIEEFIYLTKFNFKDTPEANWALDRVLEKIEQLKKLKKWSEE